MKTTEYFYKAFLNQLCKSFSAGTRRSRQALAPSLLLHIPEDAQVFLCIIGLVRRLTTADPRTLSVSQCNGS